MTLTYNLPGLSQPLNLSAATACGLLTGAITNWDAPAIAAQNPGVTLPSLAVVPVTESDAAGTNYVVEQWCIDEDPNLWAGFASEELDQPGGPTDGVPISATTPYANWPRILPNGIVGGSTGGVEEYVQSTSGSIGAVFRLYSTVDNTSVASVLNASGDYVQPSAVGVESALAYASQNSNGTLQLDFNGLGPNVYPLPAVSYLLTPTTGWDPSEGAVMSEFLDYALTVGQQVVHYFGTTHSTCPSSRRASTPS